MITDGMCLFMCAAQNFCVFIIPTHYLLLLNTNQKNQHQLNVYFLCI
jgi:hypothetical protein